MTVILFNNNDYTLLVTRAGRQAGRHTHIHTYIHICITGWQVCSQGEGPLGLTRQAGRQHCLKCYRLLQKSVIGLLGCWTHTWPHTHKNPNQFTVSQKGPAIQCARAKAGQ